MSDVERSVDAAAKFIDPFLERNSVRINNDSIADASDSPRLVEQAILHLQTINTADQAQDPDAPYDGSLVGVVYGLLDMSTTLGILPYLSPGVTFGQRPRSVLRADLSTVHRQDDELLAHNTAQLMSILDQNRSGVQPLLSQRILPDILSALAELALSPRTNEATRQAFAPQYKSIMESTLTSRLLPILTCFLGQDIPDWLRQRLAKELAMIPLRALGVRHTIEFLSLSYLSKNAQLPSGATSAPSQVPIPLEAITHVAKLLAAVPSGMAANDWFTQLAPQLWDLVDGTQGVELSRAAGQIIAGGILNRKSTGAPGTIGWTLFAEPILRAINPQQDPRAPLRPSTSDHVYVDDNSLRQSLHRLSVITSSSNHSGLIKRLIHPAILPLWALLGFAKSRPSLDAQWSSMPYKILSHYVATACDPRQADLMATNLFWDGEPWWTFGPGSHGGVEIRQRRQGNESMHTMGNILKRLEKLDDRVQFFTQLLADGNVEDDVAATVFLRITQRWLSADRASGGSKSLSDEIVDPMSALADAKLSEAMAKKFNDKFIRRPDHIIEFMGQLLETFVEEHKTNTKKTMNANKPSRANLAKLVEDRPQANSQTTGTDFEDLVCFALSILNALTVNVDNRSGPTSKQFTTIIPLLQYLSQSHTSVAISPLIVNASSNILATLHTVGKDITDPLAEHRNSLKLALTDLTSAEPPNRTWALSSLRKLICDPSTFGIIDVPLTTHLLLSASIADPESYVHTAAIPVMVDLAIRAPNPTLRILLDTFLDVDERSIGLKKEKEVEQALDFRLRIGEVLHRFICEDSYWTTASRMPDKYSDLKMLVEATLSLASRRGQRHNTLAKRNEIMEMERKTQEEGEAAWDGPIPNLLDPEGDNADQPERDALFKIIEGWEDTGIEEDVRIRSSALSEFSMLAEMRLEYMTKPMVDAGLQMVVQILTMETGDAKAILRRAALLVAMGLLRGMDALLEASKECPAGLDIQEADQIGRVIAWVRDEDPDPLSRGHAESVLEGLETWKMKRLYKIGDFSSRLNANLGLDGSLQGLSIDPTAIPSQVARRGLVEEI